MEWNTVGTDLWSADTDEDGHSDSGDWYDPDYDPLVFEERYGPLAMGREFLLGAVGGEWGADDHDNIYYLGGWVASGVIVIGDLRDIAATISRGDLVGTGLNLAALIPGSGDAAKVAVIVGRFVLKHPELLKQAMVRLISEILGLDMRKVAGASRDAPSGVERDCRDGKSVSTGRCKREKPSGFEPRWSVRTGA
ncbi:hypothetical protein F8E02_04415 [Methanoculleus sp. Wushi-C6]|uniref:Uncharacterized protein n=1 Tax=Methanoculleus caldifontis TaxID=2651577 RepID=A0ABU3WZX1_9EURY|nr:hypothetical protein [Methanoculleus sp. Wushi-C6]MDV2481261.1 hypothetical protein [Methanoculleus sp. Wushi-C6]